LAAPQDKKEQTKRQADKATNNAYVDIYIYMNIPELINASQMAVLGKQN
jgi:hypothetical protein